MTFANICSKALSLTSLDCCVHDMCNTESAVAWPQLKLLLSTNDEDYCTLRERGYVQQLAQVLTHQQHNYRDIVELGSFVSIATCWLLASFSYPAVCFVY